MTAAHKQPERPELVAQIPTARTTHAGTARGGGTSSRASSRRAGSTR